MYLAIMKIKAMKLESAIRILAGTLILTGLALGTWVNPHWVWLSAFVGANLLQSSFTGFCPAAILLGKLGVGSKANGKCCEP